ncbi:MAG TPA: hypothetical protein VFE16_12120 [Candidatus Cybelea sp.]|jgi:hypothetical protein|nr:hypothetical protein [Candidatus Cybelea sp.]
MYVQPLEGSVSPNSVASLGGNAGPEGSLLQGALAPTTGDNISRFLPPTLNNGSEQYGGFGSPGSMQGIFGSLMGVLEQLMQMLQSLMGYGSGSPFGSGGCNPPSGSIGSPPYGSTSCPPSGNERFFQNATGSSEGDPHLSFNGAKWNNMTSQPDLLNSDSFAGGFQISTQVTPTNAQGIAWNQSATISLNNGATTVTMSNDGQASIATNGQSVSIGRGETLRLGNGESVTCEENGSLRVTAENGSGGRIETTLTAEGKGVNVDVTAHDVDLGGTLVNGYERREPGPTPTPGPIPSPVPTPISGRISAPMTGPLAPPIIGPLQPPIMAPLPMPETADQEPQRVY